MESKPNLIFYHPAVLGAKASGSGLRPKYMLRAFQSICAEVFEISGEPTSIRRSIRDVKKQIRSGQHFDHLYVENLSTPMCFRNVKLGKVSIPVPKFSDFRFILFCLRKNIKVSYFYRDIYWRFPEAYGGKLSKLKLMTLKFFGYLELWFLRTFIRNVFVPTENFADLLLDKYGVTARMLMPGCEVHNHPLDSSHEAKTLRLLYVGSSGELYDPSLIFAALSQLNFCQLTFCTRENEWQSVKSKFKLPANVNVVFKAGEDLSSLYAEADLCLYTSPPSPYTEIAFSYKIAEYIGHGRPIFAYEGTYVGRFTEQNALGWTAPYHLDALVRLLRHLHENRSEIVECSREVQKFRSSQTWEKVAQKALELNK